MLRFTGNPSAEAEAAVAVSFVRLADLPLSGVLGEDRDALVVHGRLILETLPAVDGVLAQLPAARTAERVQALQNLVLDDYRRPETRARIFRILPLIATSLRLACPAL